MYVCVYTVPVQQLAQLLAVDKAAAGRCWYIQPSCATTGKPRTLPLSSSLAVMDRCI